MEMEDRRNYFVIGSVIIEIVNPMFQRQLESYYLRTGCMCLKDFLQCNIVLHTLFHLRYRNAMCCKDRNNCTNRVSLPLSYCLWGLMYSDNISGKPPHRCFCKYTANNIQLDELDITLSSVLLLNCCQLSPNVVKVISQLREIKNNYFSHNSKGTINQKEYNCVWSDITTLILSIDPSLENNLVILKRRPLDETLCYKYSTEISGIQTKLEEIDCKFNRMELLLIENSKKLDDSMRMNSRERDESDEQPLNNEKEDNHMNNSSQGGPYAECSKARKDKEYEIIYSRSSDKQCKNLVKVQNSTEPHVGIDHTTSDVDGRKKNKRSTATEHEYIKECSSIKKVKRERALSNLSSEEEIPNLENVQHIKELNVSVEQKKEASFSLFSPGCNVSVGTIVMGNQYITVTSIDQMSETSSNSTSI